MRKFLIFLLTVLCAVTVLGITKVETQPIVFSNSVTVGGTNTFSVNDVVVKGTNNNLTIIGSNGSVTNTAVTVPGTNTPSTMAPGSNINFRTVGPTNFIDGTAPPVDLSTWSYYPAQSNLNMNGKNITGAGTGAFTGLSVNNTNITPVAITNAPSEGSVLTVSTNGGSTNYYWSGFATITNAAANKTILIAVTNASGTNYIWTNTLDFTQVRYFGSGYTNIYTGYTNISGTTYWCRVWETNSGVYRTNLDLEY